MKCLFNVLGMLLGGALFGYGLAYSGMVSPEVVLRFLTWQDFGLMLVMGGAVAVTVVAYQLAPRLLRQPICGTRFDKRITPLDRKTLWGAALFGAGWGLCGVCPGPAIAGLGSGNFQLLWALAGIFAGAYLHGWWESRNAPR
jgi:uncharacterized membrane protein YedE/YeeE